MSDRYPPEALPREPSVADLQAEISRLVSQRTALTIRLARAQGVACYLAATISENFSQRFDFKHVQEGLDSCSFEDDGRVVDIQVRDE